MFRVPALVFRASKNIKPSLLGGLTWHTSDINSEGLFLTHSSDYATASEAKSEKKPEKRVQESSSFVMNLFNGEVKTDQVFPYPEVLSQEQCDTLNMIIPPTEKYFREENDPLKNDETSHIEDANMKQMGELGLFGLQVPTDLNGVGLSNTQYARMVEIIGIHDLGVGICLGAHQSIGFKGILLYGNDAQRKKYLPDVATGKKVAAYCLTEPSSGSDASSIRTKAVLSKDGSHYVLNGGKIWISNGGIAEIFTVFAKTAITKDDGTVKDKITAFIVERGFGGVTSGPPEKKMGIKASNTAELNFEDTKVPVENVLGKPGEGFKIAMNILNNGRFGMAAAMTGTMRMAIEKSIEHVTSRDQFGAKISTYGSVQEKLARMAMLHYITESMAYQVSGNMDRGFTDFQLEAAISKVFGAEAAWQVVDEAIQVHGGMGFMRGTGLEKVLRDLRIFRIFEGANDILRLFVALTGLQFAGGHLKELQQALKRPAKHMGVILDEGAKRVWRIVGLSSGPSLAEHVHPDLKNSAALLSKSVEQFGASAEGLLVKYGKNVVNEQFLLIRLANSAIDIYSMAVVLSRATRALKKGLSSAAYESNLVSVICAEAANRVENNLAELKASDRLKEFGQMKGLAVELCQKGTIVTDHPLGL